MLLCSKESVRTSVHVRRDGFEGRGQHKAGHSMWKDKDTRVILNSDYISVVFHR